MRIGGSGSHFGCFFQDFARTTLIGHGYAGGQPKEAPVETTASATSSAHSSHWTLIGLACIVTLTISAGCSLTEPTPRPAASSSGSSGPQSGPLTKGPATAVLVGEVVAAAVVNSDMQCFISWDANALCRWFTV